MPKQSRGFFTCDFCGLALDTLDEATEHEQTCTKRPLYPAHYPPHYRGLPPHATRAYRYGEPESNYPGGPQYFPARFRVVALMGPNDRRTSVAKDDIPCVQSLELFETPPDIASLLDGIGGVSVSPRQVGLRCSYCATSKPNEKNTMFPTTIAAIASGVRQMAENHLPICEAAPTTVREACLEAKKNRQQKSRDENDQDKIDLLEYCSGFSQHLGIVNKHSQKMGIAFGDTEGPFVSYSSAETPATARGSIPGAPGGPFSLGERSGPAPPGPYDHPTGFPPVARPMPMMSGHMLGPGDAIAPTPLQRRRDRPDNSSERGPYPNSGERGYGAPTPVGYPTPYSQGPPGSERRYGQDIQTPAQPVFEGKGQTPMSSRQSDTSPPQGYTPFELPPNFPYYQEADQTWHCKFCCHLHPSYRDPGAIWQSNNGAPPPASFIDSHLSVCRSYHHHQSTAPTPMYQGPPPPYGAHWMASGYPPPQGWEGHSFPPPVVSPPSHHHQMRYPGPPPGPHEPPYPYPQMSHEEYEASRKAGPNRDPKRLRDGHQHAEQRVREPPHPGTSSSVAYLTAKENEYIMRNPTAKKNCLVLEEDRLLLTDYFYHLMLQLQLCRFSESDRKTRGGKREKISLGYGGLQCVHCADIPNSRKFFWSNVDRLANSFAEIPGHVLKCRRCPEATKAALLDLKQYHPEQMARLPRGSQKVFFRRMWRRLHDEDAEIAAAMMASREDQENEDKANKDDSAATSPKKGQEADTTSDEEDSFIKPSTEEAAQILAEYARNPVPASESSRVLLAICNDREWISDMDCYIRKQLELFCATEADVEIAREDRKFPIHVGQVGIRCIHSSMACKGDDVCSGTAVSYPFQVHGIYESVREFQRLHLDSCPHIPDSVKRKVASFKGASSLSSVLRKYYAMAANALGLYDTPEGIRAGGDCIPIGSESSTFSLAGSESGSPVSLPGDNKRHESPNALEGGPAMKKTKSEKSGQASEISDSEAEVLSNTETKFSEPTENATDKTTEEGKVASSPDPK